MPNRLRRGLVVKSKVFLICTGLFAAASVAYPVLAGGNFSTIGFGDGGTIPERGFLKIAPSAIGSSAVPLQQFRLDTSLVPAIEPYASLKPWVGTERTGNRGSFGVGGVLVDVPLGGFVFTPSFGAGSYTEANGHNPGNSLQFRSALGLGYQLNDQSRLSLDYSHTSTSAQIPGGPSGGNTLSFTVRLPSSWLLGQ